MQEDALRRSTKGGTSYTPKTEDKPLTITVSGKGKTPSERDAAERHREVVKTLRKSGAIKSAAKPADAMPDTYGDYGGGKKAKSKAAPKSKSKSKSKGGSMADWAKGEQEKLRADKKAQKLVQASIGDQAGRRGAKRTGKAKSNMRKLGSVMRKGKGGVASYKDFMGG